MELPWSLKITKYKPHQRVTSSNLEVLWRNTQIAYIGHLDICVPNMKAHNPIQKAACAVFNLSAALGIMFAMFVILIHRAGLQ